MKNKVKLLIIAALVLIVITGAFLIQTINNSPNSVAPIKVACIGDSLTEGSNYPEDLWILLGANYTVGNFGYSGTSVSLHAPTPYMSEGVFQEALKFEPTIVIIMLGTNDALPSLKNYSELFVDDYLTLITRLKTLESEPKIWLVLPPPIWHNGTGLSTEFLEQQIIPGVKQVAEKAQLPTIDVYSALLSHPDFFPYDGVHPTEEGAQFIANEIYKAISGK